MKQLMPLASSQWHPNCLAIMERLDTLDAKKLFKRKYLNDSKYVNIHNLLVKSIRSLTIQFEKIILLLYWVAMPNDKPDEFRTNIQSR